MPKSAYCGYCGREFLLKEQSASGGVPYCSVECLEAAAKQEDLVEQPVEAMPTQPEAEAPAEPAPATM